MKISSAVLAVSLAANTLFAVAFFAASIRQSPSMQAPPGSRHIPDAGASPNHSSVDPEAWAKLDPKAPAAMIDRLRREGFPPDVIRALVAEQVRVQFAARRAALNSLGKEQPFWMPTNRDAKTQAALNQLTKEQEQAVKDLLGSDGVNNATEKLRRQFPNLSDDKIAKLVSLDVRYGQMRSDLAESGGYSGPERVAIDKAARAELKSILTPEELEEDDLRRNNTAKSLRSQLAGFNPTEQEFRTLFRLQHTFDEQYQLENILGFPSESQQQMMRQRSEAQKQLQDQMKAALGEDRYADYQRSIDGNYQQTSRLVARLELPPETASQVYAVQQDLQQRVRAMQMDRTLAADARNTQLAALAAEAQSKITATLGPSGYEAYKQYGGSWMQQLQPRPGPTLRPANSTDGQGGSGGGGWGRSGGG